MPNIDDYWFRYKSACEIEGQKLEYISKQALTELIAEIISSPVEPEVIKKNADGLLPCPFCARTNMKIIAWDGGYYTVVCKCGIEAPKDSVSKNGAIRIWNRRR